ncbi:hypothetical protein QNN01_36420 [Bradyrhizobium diazoefficiens]|nr:hypothetical protein [Bradyrhizobium diazoefficiens]WLA63803.1 hypothetical protein QNN01_36420 [Bradyrhizobium diazoefficiens]
MVPHPASWRFPTHAETRLLTRNRSETPASAGRRTGGRAPPEYWQSLLDDPRAEARPAPSGSTLRLSQIPQHLLRMGCRRCGRTVEIQKVDAVRLYGRDALWKAVGQRLLDNTCAQRTGRHEEDGCWPTFE